MYFIILLGIVSLFGGVAYEGARSVSGPYLRTLGASAGVVGLVAGIGEFTGHALRLASGYVADRTKAYWLLTFIGYGVLLSIPLLVFAGYWQLAAVHAILERVGKAIGFHQEIPCCLMPQKSGERLGVCCSRSIRRSWRHRWPCRFFFWCSFP